MLLNHGITEFHNIVSLNIFKNQLIKLIRPNAKSIFKLYDTLGIKILYQLRVGLSPLKCHKNHNFMDTPDDWCICLSAPEDTQHFLLKCTLFSVQRVKLISSVNNLLANTNLLHLIDDYKLYLYGHHYGGRDESRDYFKFYCVLKKIRTQI